MDIKLQRLRYLLRRYLSSELLQSADLEVLAEEEAGRFALYFTAKVFAAREIVVVDGGPDGRWQMVKAVLGLPHRRIEHRVDAHAIFPRIKGCGHEVVLRVEDPS